jgi:hypothetical protein
MSKTRILIRLLRVYFPWNWEFGSALSKLRNFGTPLSTVSNKGNIKITNNNETKLATAHFSIFRFSAGFTKHEENYTNCIQELKRSNIPDWQTFDCISLYHKNSWQC